MSDVKQLFLIDPSITYLNFGSFGACPKPVFENYQKWQLELEREPVQFMMKSGPAYLQTSRKALAEYVICEQDDIIFVPNPTHALNIVTKSLVLQPGDEVLGTNLEYGACDRTWEYYCEKAGAKYIKQNISLPIVSKEKFLEDFFKGVSSRTKVIFVSHITSSTALVFPVEEICKKSKELNLLCIVDGAHAPGQIELNIKKLDPDIYIGACHKWMMTPKGCSFLYLNKKHQKQMDPLIVSWGYKSAAPSASQFQDYHQFNGTRDFSAYLTVPAAIAFMREHKWEEYREKSKQLVLENAPRFCELLETKAMAPLNKNFIAQMLSLEINCEEPENLQKILFEQYKIEIPVMRHESKVFIRYSICAFNTQTNLDALYNALAAIKSEGRLLNKEI